MTYTNAPISEHATAPIRDDCWTFVVLTADAVIGGQVDPILARIEAHDLEPAVCVVVGLDEGLMRRAFLVGDPTAPEAVHWLATFGELYRFAPACLVMLRRPAGAACGVMLDCKGATRPEQARSGTVRHAGENVFFNLVHCPDDAGAAWRELSELLGRRSARRLVESALEPDPRLVELLGLDALRARLPLFAGREATSFVAVANRVRARVVQRLCLELAPRHYGELAAVQRLLAGERRALAGVETSRERMLDARRASHAIQPALRALAARSESPAIAAGVDALGELYELTGERRPEAVLAMAGDGVYVSPLERAIVRCHSFAFVPSDDLEGVYA